MSEFKFSCPNCGQHLTATPAHTGLAVKCPSCQTELRVPAPPSGFAAGTAAPAPPLASPPPPVIPAIGPRSSAAAGKSSNRGLIIGMTIGGIALLFLVMLGVGALLFVRSVKSEVARQQARMAQGEADQATSLRRQNSPTSPTRQAADKQVATDPASAEIPNASVAGTLGGNEFKLARARLEGGILKLADSDEFIADQEVLIFLFLGADKPAGKTILIPNPEKKWGGPHVHIRYKQGDTTKSEAMTDKYAMRLEFGQPTSGKIPGKIYLELPERHGTRLAGTFEASMK